MKPEKIIIDRPSRLGSPRRVTENVVTLIGWGFWFFLARPLLTLVLWLLGFRIFYAEFARYSLENALFIIRLILILLGLYLVIRGWNFYKSRRFSHYLSHRKKSIATDDAVGALFQIRPQQVRELKKCRNVDVHFLEDFRLLLKDSRTPSSSPIRGRYIPPNIIIPKRLESVIKEAKGQDLPGKGPAGGRRRT